MDILQFAEKGMMGPVPFLEKGRSWDGWDCWGLACLAYQEILEFRLRDYATEYRSTRDYRRLAELYAAGKHLDGWVGIENPEPMDLALIFRRGRPVHAGLVIPGRRILHTEEGVDTLNQPFSQFQIEGFYRPEELV